MEKIKRYDVYSCLNYWDCHARWCRSEDVERLEAELELALSCLNEDQLDEMETKRLDTAL